MWNRLAKILSNKKVMGRLLFTLVLVFIYRLVNHIPVPLFNTSAITSLLAQEGSFLAILNNYTGGGLERFSVLALGISPYITASIVMQLLAMVVPTIKEWSTQGQDGKMKMNRVTRYLAIILAFVQGLALILGADQGTGSIFVAGIINPTIWHYLYMALVITAGTAFAIWIGDLITKKGIGNGTSILIVVGIVTSLPKMITALNNKYLGANFDGVNLLLYIIIILLMIAILLGIVYLQIATRKIPIQYANRQGKSDSHIPMMLNSAGVIPVIFASTIMSVPLTIVGLLNPANVSGGFAGWTTQIFDSSKPVGFIVYVLLIVVFSFFYSFMQVDPEKIAENLSKSNAYIPGVRPGDDTKDFIARLLFKITVIGTIYLVLLAVTPIITSLIFGFTPAEASLIQIGGTSLLIIVGVAIETTQQIETDADNTTYSGIFG